jgi:ABC-type branched-subunit amino acid transport system permease subunit
MTISMQQFWGVTVGWLLSSIITMWLGSQERRLIRFLGALEVLAFAVLVTIVTYFIPIELPNHAENPTQQQQTEDCSPTR